MLFHVGGPGGLFQFHILLEEGKGLGVIGMGVQIESQLQNDEVQSPKLIELRVGQLAGGDLQVEGQIQFREERA